MKKIYPLFASVILLVSACGDTDTDHEKKKCDSDSVQIATVAPFTMNLINPTSLGTDSLQSFAMGELNGKWLIVGGRTNGFHGTGGTTRTFPVAYANTQFIVYDPNNDSIWTAPLPAQYMQRLSSTNMEYYQDGNVLWLAGGYGSNNGTDCDPCYNTFPYITAIDLDELIPAIIGHQTNLDQYIHSRQDDRFQVTGGAMKKLGDYTYLIMGQNYDTTYVNGITGQYTEEIRKFKLSATSGIVTVSDYSATQNSQFHRRDLNVLEAVRPGGKPGINVFAGVFQPNAEFGAPWSNPVLIDLDNSGNMTYKIDTSFTQNFNAYDCGHIMMYDTIKQIMYTTLLGGITNYTLDASGKPVPASSFLPWSKYISTIAQYPNGITKEYPQANPLLPGFIGASGETILKQGLPIMAGTKNVIDFAQLPAGDNLLGWFYGGILSTAEQTNAVSNPSFASATIYEIHLYK